MGNNHRPRKSSEPKIVTSVNLPISYVDWINQHGESLSDFIRRATQEKIERNTGYQERIKTLEQKVKLAHADLERLENELYEAKAMHEDWEQSKEMKELSDLITRAVNNISYESAEDAIEDLRTARSKIPNEAFEDLVRKIWEETRIESRINSTGDMGEGP